MSDKEKWQMTQAEFRPIGVARGKEVSPRQPEVWYEQQADANHRRCVSIALNRGWPVPAEVLADYPDLKDGREEFQKSCGLIHPLTDLTYDLRKAVNEQPSKYRQQWKDKPHRLVYDACAEIERLTQLNKELAEVLEFIVNDSEPGEDARLTVDGYNRACNVLAKHKKGEAY